MDKPALLAAHRAHLEQALAQVRQSQDQARDGTRVDGSHRPSNRGERAAVTSQGYLAQGLAQRIGELEAALQLLGQIDPGPRHRVAVGALVELVEPGARSRQLLILPGGDGSTHAGVRVVSPSSPLIAPLMGLESGDGDEVLRGGALVEVEVRDIR